MPVPSSITELSQTAGSNYPASSESPTTADDYFRTHAAFLATLRDGKGFSTEATVASAAATDIGGVNSLYVNVTGTTTITSFGATYSGPRFVRFAGALTLTHNAASLILPGGASITTAAGDTCVAVPIAGGWVVSQYQRADGTILSAALASISEAQAGMSTTKALTPSTMKAAQIVLGTAVASTSGASIDFTGIPSYAKRINVMFQAMSTNGASPPRVQAGTESGVVSSGYAGATTDRVGGGFTNLGAGFDFGTATTATASHSGILVLKRMAGNVWVAKGTLARGEATQGYDVDGYVSLGGVLDRIRITTVGGVNTFDAGVVNISWE